MALLNLGRCNILVYLNIFQALCEISCALSQDLADLRHS